MNRINQIFNLKIRLRRKYFLKKTNKIALNQLFRKVTKYKLKIFHYKFIYQYKFLNISFFISISLNLNLISFSFLFNTLNEY